MTQLTDKMEGLRYRTKDVEIEAIIVQVGYRNLTEIIAFVGEDNLCPIERHPNYILKIKTLEGNMSVSYGDYIIKGLIGEVYPCKPDAFEMKYELVLAEATVVGDWEVEFEKQFDHIVASQGGFIVGRRGSNFDNCATGLDGIKDFITTLLAAKDREREDAVTETLQEMMDWAMDNGITDEKSFCALRDYLTEKALPLTK